MMMKVAGRMLALNFGKQQEKHITFDKQHSHIVVTYCAKW